MIVLLVGGPSSEREVSQWSGKSVAKSLKKLGIEYKVIDPTKSDWLERVIALNPTKVISALHGRYGEDGTVTALLERNRVPFAGSATTAQKLAWNKQMARELVASIGTPIPEGRIVNKSQKIDQNSLQYPVVVKPIEEGSSFGVSIVSTAEELPAALQLGFEYGDQLLVEQFINGTELTLGVIDFRGGVEALPIVEIRPKTNFFDFKAKYDANYCDEIVPAPIDPKIAKKIQALAVKIFQKFGCRDYARIDFILKGDTPFFLEINTLPGFAKTSLMPKSLQAAGISFDQFVSYLAQ